MYSAEEVIDSLNAAQEAINKAFEMLYEMKDQRPEVKKRIDNRVKPNAPVKRRKKNEKTTQEVQGREEEQQVQVHEEEQHVQEEIERSPSPAPEREPSPRGTIVVQVPGETLPSKKTIMLDEIVYEKESLIKLRQAMVKWLQELKPLPVTESMDHFIALVDISKQMSLQNEYINKMGNHYPQNIKIVKRILLALPTDGFRKQLDQDGNPPKRGKQFGFYLDAPYFSYTTM